MDYKQVATLAEALRSIADAIDRHADMHTSVVQTLSLAVNDLASAVRSNGFA